MAETFADDLRWHAGHEQQRRGRMPEAVKRVREANQDRRPRVERAPGRLRSSRRMQRLGKQNGGTRQLCGASRRRNHAESRHAHPSTGNSEVRGVVRLPATFPGADIFQLARHFTLSFAATRRSVYAPVVAGAFAVFVVAPGLSAAMSSSIRPERADPSALLVLPTVVCSQTHRERLPTTMVGHPPVRRPTRRGGGEGLGRIGGAGRSGCGQGVGAQPAPSPRAGPSVRRRSLMSCVLVLPPSLSTFRANALPSVERGSRA